MLMSMILRQCNSLTWVDCITFKKLLDFNIDIFKKLSMESKITMGEVGDQIPACFGNVIHEE